MEFTPYLDTRELSKLAEEALVVGQAFLDGDENLTKEEISDDNHTFRSMSSALTSLGYPVTRAEEYPDMWTAVGNSYHVTLVREDTIGEYWKEASLDFGRLNPAQHEEFGPVIDWDAYARNQDATVVNFNDTRKSTTENYYIF
jgi:hypothetical protein